MITSKKLLWHIMLLYCSLMSIQAYGGVVAFPGAEGFGCEATGGRGGEVYIVTNLDDSGPGSFRDAVSQSNRTVVFAVDGIIKIKERVVVKDHITIAGQTAPGDGVVIYGNGISFSGADHSIVRYMRFRMGSNGSKGKDAISIAHGSPMIFDHCSVSWGRDENFSISGDDGFYTIQNSIISQGLHSHSCGGLIQNWGGVSILRCLYIDNHTRNPKVKGVNQYVNNVIYNWRVAGYILGGGSSGISNANVISNYFISGPDTGSKPAFSRANENFHIFALNNFHDNNRNGILDGFLIQRQGYGPVTWENQRFNYPQLSSIFTPEIAYKLAVSNAGASKPKRDPVDSLLINQLISLGRDGGIIAKESELPTNGPGIVKGGDAPVDTDKDGMPDYWEKVIPGLKSDVKDNNGDVNNNGYSNLEDYLNWMASVHIVVKRGESVKVDLKEYSSGFSSAAKHILATQLPGAAIMSDGHTLAFDTAGKKPGLYNIDCVIVDGEPVNGCVSFLVIAE